MQYRSNIENGYRKKSLYKKNQKNGGGGGVKDKLLKLSIRNAIIDLKEDRPPTTKIQRNICRIKNDTINPSQGSQFS